MEVIIDSDLVPIIEGIKNSDHNLDITCLVISDEVFDQFTRALFLISSESFSKLNPSKVSCSGSPIICFYNEDIKDAFINWPEIIDYQKTTDFSDEVFNKLVFLATQYLKKDEIQKKQNNRLSLILKNSHEAVIIYDEEARISFASQKVTDILGLNHCKEIINTKAHDWVHKKDREEGHILFSKLINEEVKSLEVKQRLITKRGAPVWVHAKITDERRTEGIKGFISNFSIIEEEYEAKKIAFLEAQKYRFFTDKVSFIVFGLDAEGGLNFINDFGQEKLGINLDTLPYDEDWSSFIHKDDFDNVIKKWEQAAMLQKPYSVSAKIKLADSCYYSHNIYADPIFDDNNRLNGWLGICTNVEEDSKLKEELKREKQRFEQAQLISDIGDWEYHPDSGEINFSSNMYEIFDLSPSEPIPPLTVFTEEFHKDDAELLVSSMENALTGGIEYDIDIRLDSPKGNRKILRCIAKRFQRPDKQFYLAGVSQDITERVSTLNSLEESRTRFTEFINNAPFGAMVIDELGKIILVNPAIHEYFQDTDRFEERNIQSAFDIENSLKIDKALKRVLQSGKSEDCILKVASDRHYLYFSASFFTLGKEASDLMQIGCLIEDITQRYLQEEELLKSEERLYATQSMAGLGDWYYDIATNTVDWSPMLFEIFQRDTSKGKINYEEVFENYYEEDTVELKKHIENCLEKGIPYELIITLKKPFGKTIRAKGFPIYNKKNEITALRGTVQDITESIGKDILLQESEKRYELASKATSDTVWEYNPKTGTVIWGESLKENYGYPDKYLNSTIEVWENWIHPKDKDEVVKSLNTALASKENFWQTEYRFRKHNGTYAYVKDRGYIVKDERGRAIKAVGAMQDITEKKEREEHLKLLESVITNTKDSIIITESEPQEKHKNGPKIIYVNKAFTEITGYTSEEVIGLTPRILQGPETDSKELDRLRQAIGNWESCSIEVINYKKDGTKFWNSFQVDPVKNEHGWYTHWISVQRDISAGKQAETELKHALLRYDLATLSKDIGIWEFDFKNQHMYWDDTMYEMYGYNKKNYDNANGLWEKSVHPDDYARAKRKVDESIEKGYLLENYFRIITPDKKIKHLQVSAIAQKNEDGEPIRYVGVNRDVTEYIEAQERLEKAKKAQEDILTSITEGFFAINDDFTITYWNKAAEQIMNKSSQEVVGKNLWDVYPEALSTKFYTTFKKAIQTKTVRSTLDYYEPNNQWLEATAFPKENGLTVFFHDVTERMRYTKALERQNQQLQKIAWSHSHEVRSPLARIITLVDYINNYDDGSIELNQLLEYVKTSAEELDKVIHRIVKNTEEVKLAEESIRRLN